MDLYLHPAVFYMDGIQLFIHAQGNYFGPCVRRSDPKLMYCSYQCRSLGNWSVGVLIPWGLSLWHWCSLRYTDRRGITSLATVFLFQDLWYLIQYTYNNMITPWYDSHPHVMMILNIFITVFATLATGKTAFILSAVRDVQANCKKNSMDK